MCHSKYPYSPCELGFILLVAKCNKSNGEADLRRGIGTRGGAALKVPESV